MCYELIETVVAAQVSAHSSQMGSQRREGPEGCEEHDLCDQEAICE